MRPGDTDGRKAAFTALLEFEARPGPMDRISGRCLAGLEGREAGLAFALVQGVLRWRGLLDGVLQHFCRRPLAQLDPPVLVGLRLGLFQILFLDRVPDHAAVGATLVAGQGLGLGRKQRGFVNGVLRAVLRQRGHGNQRDIRLAVGLKPHQAVSHPAWLWRRYVARYGEAGARELAMANNRTPELGLTVLDGDPGEMASELTAAGLTVRPGTLAARSLLVATPPGDPGRLPVVATGRAIVQDQGALLLCELLQDAPPGPILDGCAGLGGKTMVLARLLAGRSLVAVEPEGRRFCLLTENLRRTGTRAHCRRMSLEAFAADCQEKTFAGILLDAPCSGLGVIRRHPEIRWLRQERDLARYQQRQLRLLTAAADLVIPGGLLVYATCSTEPEENEEVVAAFLRHRPEFRLAPAGLAPTAHMPPLVDDHGYLRLRPCHHPTDGFFAARLQRR